MKKVKRYLAFLICSWNAPCLMDCWH